MNPLLIVAAVVFLWWAVGAFLIMYASRSYVEPNAPLVVRAIVLLKAGFVIPWLAMKNGSVPIVVVVPSHMNAEEQARYDSWASTMAADCQCHACKARRGEQ